MLKNRNFVRTTILTSVHDKSRGGHGCRAEPGGWENSWASWARIFALTSLAGVPLCPPWTSLIEEAYFIVVWKWREEMKKFQIHFGLEPELSVELLG